VEELGHNRSHDDDGRLALNLEALGEGHVWGQSSHINIFRSKTYECMGSVKAPG
jgi:hypothetical protein